MISTGTPLNIKMKEEREQKKKILMFDESNVMGANIDKLISITRKALCSEQAVHIIQTKSVSR